MEVTINESPFTPKHFDYQFFDIGRSAYMEGIALFYYYNSELGNLKRVYDINMTEARIAFSKEYAAEIKTEHGSQIYCTMAEEMRYTNLYYLLHNGIIININNDRAYIYYKPSLESDAQKMTDWFRQFIRKEKKNVSIHLVVNGLTGLTLTELKLKKPRLKIVQHYNDDLQHTHKTIVKNIRAKNKSGLILLHGKPGTGKSTYIRYLIHQTCRKVIFLPPKLAGNLDSPGVIELLIDNPRSIIVIEDAEQLLTSRDTNVNSGISALLNLTDGLLSESLGIQVIATFNTHIDNIDKALLRKGRLVALYEFQDLDVRKSQHLLQEIGITDHIVTHPLSLAEIYNLKDEEFSFTQVARPIGFLSRVG